MSKMKTGRFLRGLWVLLLVVFAAGPALSEVNVNIHIGPPAVVVAGPPEMIVVPRTMIYFAPAVEVDLFFYAGFWWTPKQGRWFRSRAYNGPFVIVATRAVPVEIIRVPRDFRRRYAHGHRIPYGQLKKHYASRDRERRERRGDWKEWNEEGREHRKEKSVVHKKHGKEGRR